MGLGTQIRMQRVFNHPSGNLFGIAMDHFASYGNFPLGSGLSDLGGSIRQVMAAQPDSMTLNIGAAKSFWPPFAARAALVIETGMFTADDRLREIWTEPEDAARLGADAIAVAIAVRGPHEGQYIRRLAEAVRKAEKLELPVFAHIYPRNYDGDVPFIEFTPEQIAWAVRVGIETGVDVIKVGYPGDQRAFSEIVSWANVPVVVAGGPAADTVEVALQYVREALDAGAKGAVVGRNIWGDPDPVRISRAYAAVIHDGRTPADALTWAAAPSDRVV